MNATKLGGVWSCHLIRRTRFEDLRYIRPARDPRGNLRLRDTTAKVAQSSSEVA